MNSNRRIIRTVSALAAGAVIATSGVPVSAASLEDTSKAVDNVKNIASAKTSSKSALSGISLKLADILADQSGSEAKAEANETDTVSASNTSAETREETVDPYANIGIVVTGEATLNVRSRADASASIVGKLYNNNACTVVENLGDWLHITSGNVDGYVASAYVTVGDAATCQAAQTHTATVNCDGLYVRSEATTDSSVVELVSNGTQLNVTDLSLKDQGWIGVSDDDVSGYVSADYVTVNDIYSYGETTDEIAAREAAEAAAAQAEAEAAAKAAQAAATQKSAAASSASTQSAQKSESASAASSQTSVSAPTSSNGAAVASYAAQFVGNPYAYGGTSLTNGADCSGFVMAVYARFGVSLPHSSSGDRSVGTAVSVSDMQAGDIVCYNGHVGIYAGNGSIINAANPSKGITYTNVNYSPIVSVRRVL